MSSPPALTRQPGSELPRVRTSSWVSLLAYTQTLCHLYLAPPTTEEGLAEAPSLPTQQLDYNRFKLENSMTDDDHVTETWKSLLGIQSQHGPVTTS